MVGLRNGKTKFKYICACGWNAWRVRPQYGLYCPKCKRLVSEAGYNQLTTRYYYVPNCFSCAFWARSKEAPSYGTCEQGVGATLAPNQTNAAFGCSKHLTSLRVLNRHIKSYSNPDENDF